MKKLLALFILFSVFTSCSYDINMTRYQNKNLRKFNSVCRAKHRVKFKNRAHVYHPAVRKPTRKILKQRYRENIFTRSSY